MTPLLELHDVTKSFAGVRVLLPLDLVLRPGHALGLVGENGAGKSTLIHLLGGSLQPESGRMLLDGQLYAPKNPKEAGEAGIAVVHQELNLFPNLTLLENLFLTHFPRRGPWIHRSAARERAREWLDRVGLDISPDTPVERLTAGERQLVEIARALGQKARLLILDEPTTSLTQPECQRLFNQLRRLRHEGVSWIFISHALQDVLDLTDDLMVLRDGQKVAFGPTASFTLDHVVSAMVGRRLDQLFPQRSGTPSGELLMDVRDLEEPGILQPTHFQLRRGEVLGVAGLMGAGRTEMARLLFGLDPARSGEVRLLGKRITGGPRQRIRSGLAFLTESRRDDGLCLEASVEANLESVGLESYSTSPTGWLRQTHLKGALEALRASVQLQSRVQWDQPVKTLSGGNQQKIALGKWLLNPPRVLLLDEPTRGVDVGARRDIYELLLNLADQGLGILWISSELEELIGVCDRILVMHRGRIHAEFDRPEFDQERILQAALGTSPQVTSSTAGRRNETTDTGSHAAI